MEKLQNMLLGLILLAGITVGSACPTPMPPVPPGPTPIQPDAAPGTAAEATCANLQRLGCPEGLRPDCVVVVQKTIDLRTTDLKLDCLIAAETIAAVQACGTVECRQ